MFGLNECKLVLIQRKRVLEAGFSWTLMLISLPRRTYRLVKRETWVIAFCLSLVKPGSATVSLSALEKDVDFLPMARSVVQLTTWGSVLFWQPPSSRSLTVLSEERDASPLDLLIVSEACEIGELGNEVIVFSRAASALPRLNCPSFMVKLTCVTYSRWERGIASSTSVHRFYSRIMSVRQWIVTWLILPVVICLSQRLSHACLSINKFVL